MTENRSSRVALAIALALGVSACFGAKQVVLAGAAPPGPSAHRVELPPAAPATEKFWVERFDGPSLAWVAPLGQGPDKISKVFSVQRDNGTTFLHARHDGRPEGDRPPFMHFGKRFDPGAPPLEKVKSLRWKWRVLEHPANTTNMWEDVAASLYVIIKPPSVLGGGKGFRFGWLAGDGVKGTFRLGLARIAVREGPASKEWQSEEVDVCAKFRELFGPCEGEHLNYVGVATEADGTHSVAEADYTDFELIVQK